MCYTAKKTNLTNKISRMVKIRLVGIFFLFTIPLKINLNAVMNI